MRLGGADVEDEASPACYSAAERLGHTTAVGRSIGAIIE